MGDLSTKLFYMISLEVASKITADWWNVSSRWVRISRRPGTREGLNGTLIHVGSGRGEAGRGHG